MVDITFDADVNFAAVAGIISAQANPISNAILERFIGYLPPTVERIDFKNDPLAQTWYTKPLAPGSSIVEIFVPPVDPMVEFDVSAGSLFAHELLHNAVAVREQTEASIPVWISENQAQWALYLAVYGLEDATQIVRYAIEEPGIQDAVNTNYRQPLGEQLILPVTGLQAAGIYEMQVLGASEPLDVLQFASPSLVQDSYDPAIVLAELLAQTYGDFGDASSSNDVLLGDQSNQSVNGLAGNDAIYGRGGNDSLTGSAGDDELFGGTGNDWFRGGSGADSFSGGAGTDTVSYTNSGVGLRLKMDNASFGTHDAAGDTFSSIEKIWATQYGDNIQGTDGSQTIYGLNGVDLLYGRDGDDKLYGGSGNDKLYGGDGADFLSGGSGRDLASYSDADPGLRVDLQYASLNLGIAAGDTFSSVEDLWASNHSDNLRGDAGNNTIWARGGNDTLYGRDGNDRLYGGSGSDSFIFHVSHGGVDRVEDFQDNVDVIKVTGYGFTSVSALLATATETVAGNVIFDIGNNDQVIVINSTISELSDDVFIV